jgi:hypothetical protein
MWCVDWLTPCVCLSSQVPLVARRSRLPDGNRVSPIDIAIAIVIDFHTDSARTKCMGGVDIDFLSVLQGGGRVVGTTTRSRASKGGAFAVSAPLLAPR